MSNNKTQERQEQTNGGESERGKSFYNSLFDRDAGGTAKSGGSSEETQGNGVPGIRQSDGQTGDAVQTEVPGIDGHNRESERSAKKARRTGRVEEAGVGIADDADNGARLGGDDRGQVAQGESSTPEGRLKEESVKQKFEEEKRVFEALAKKGTKAVATDTKTAEEPVKRGRGRPRKTEGNQATESKKPAPPKEKDIEEWNKRVKPLSEEEEILFVDALEMGYDLMDLACWHLGLDTDPEQPRLPLTTIPTEDGEALLPGVPIWHLERETIEKVHLKLFRRLAKRYPVLNAQARVVISLMDYYQFGLITVRQVGQTILGFVSNGFKLRLMTKEKFAEHVSRQIYETQGGVIDVKAS